MRLPGAKVGTVQRSDRDPELSKGRHFIEPRDAGRALRWSVPRILDLMSSGELRCAVQNERPVIPLTVREQQERLSAALLRANSAAGAVIGRRPPVPSRTTERRGWRKLVQSATPHPRLLAGLRTRRVAIDRES